MNATRIPLVVAGALLALTLSACGGGTVTFSPAASTATTGGTAGSGTVGSGAGVSVGADGLRVADGSGNVVTAGTDGVSVRGADGSSVSAGTDGVSANGGGGGTGGAGAGSAGSVGDRQGTFGTTGQVSLGGALAWQGRVDAGCDVNGDQRTITATVDGYQLIVDANGPDQVTLSVRGTGEYWEADFNGDGGTVVSMTARRTTVNGARLTGAGGTVTMDASFGC
jgi:hypothetical protein